MNLNFKYFDKTQTLQGIASLKFKCQRYCIIYALVLIQIYRKEMNFYQKELDAIAQDEADNQILRELAHKYASLKSNYTKIENQHRKTINELENLKNMNTKLQKQVNWLKTFQKTACSGQKQTLSSTQPKDKLYSSNRSLSGQFAKSSYQKTFDITINSQETKRKIINGFVNQLSSELDLTDQLLKRQRLMLEETRRALEMSNNQLSRLRVTCCQLENQLSSMSYQNQTLKETLDHQLRQKEHLLEQLERIHMEFEDSEQRMHIKNNEIEEELDTMDKVYRFIEFEIGKSQLTA